MPNESVTSGIEPLEGRIAPATFAWNVDASGNWNDPANWSLVSGAAGVGFPNAASDVAQFSSVITANSTVMIPNGVTITVGSIVFDDDNNYTISVVGSGALRFDVAAGNAAISAVNSSGNGAHTIDAPIALLDNLSVSNLSTGKLTLSGAIGQSGGSRSLTKLGPGTLQLSGAQGNTYGGNTFIFDGVMELNKSGGATATGLNLSVGDNSGGADADVLRLLAPGNIPSGAVVSVGTSGVLDLNGQNQTLAAISLAAGDTSGASVTTGSGVLTSSTVAVPLNGTGAVGATLTGNFTIPASANFNILNGAAAVDLTLDGVILGGHFTKSGIGTLRLAGAVDNGPLASLQIFDGVVEVAKTGGAQGLPTEAIIIGDNSGPAASDVLRLLASEQLDPGVSILVQSEGWLDMDGTVESITALSLKVGATSGSLITTGGGLLQLQDDMAVTGGGNVGARIVGNLDLAQFGHSINVGATGPAVGLEIEGAISGPGSLNINGFGTVRFSGAVPNSYSGSTTVALGTLELAKENNVLTPNAVPGSLAIGGSSGAANSATVRLLGPNQIGNAAVVGISPTGRFDLNGFDETIGSLSISANLAATPAYLSGGARLTLTSIAAFGAAGASPMVINGDLASTGQLNVSVNDFGLSADLELTGSLSAANFLTSGTGTIRLSGTASNVFTNTAFVGDGTLELAKTGGAVAFGVPNVFVGNSVGATGSTVLRLLGPGQIPNGTPITMGAEGLFDLNGQDFTAGALTFTQSGSTANSMITTGAGTLTLGGNITVNPLATNTLTSVITGQVDLGNAPRSIGAVTPSAVNRVNLRFDAVISGNQPLAINALGIELAAANTYTGDTTVSGGTLFVTGSTGDVILAGGTLGGTGTVGEVSSTAAGPVQPGVLGVDVLRTGTFTPGTGSVIALEINGTTPGVDADQIAVTGTVDLTGATLAIISTTLPAGNRPIVILDNDNTDAISGAFDGVAEGGGVTVGGKLFRISYAGGDGNDVTLTRVIPEVTLLKPNVVTFTDADGDLVTIKTNRGVFTADMFTLEPVNAIDSNAQLTLLDFTGTTGFAGANISITAKRGPTGGNGFANVGYFDAAGIDLGAVTIAGDLGRIDAGAVKALTVQSFGVLGTSTQAAGGSLVSNFSGKLGKLTVKSSIHDATILGSSSIGPVKISGSFLGGRLSAGADLGAVTVRGDIVGTSTAPVVVSAFGKAVVPVKGSDLAIKALKVVGDVEFLRVLAGYDLTLTGMNADASIGAISVGADWRASTVLAGVGVGGDGFAGTVDDVKSGGRDTASIFATIASVTIKGQAFGTVASLTDSFGIVAEQINAAKIGGVKFKFVKGPASAATAPDVFAIAPTGPGVGALPFDFFIREITI